MQTQLVVSEPLPLANGHIDLREIELGHIRPWVDLQVRRSFDEGELQELAASIREKGVLQPIVVRPIYRSLIPQRFEIVVGERRWRASKIAGVETIPAIVRDLDDTSALEIQLIENLQRSDLSPIEEAAGYRRLIDEHLYTVDRLAEKIGKSSSYIYARLKMLGLPNICGKALDSGIISPSVAELVGRMPNEELREKLCGELFAGVDPPTYRATRELIERRYVRELKGAPFNQSDKKLLSSAGSCEACPKRTGNNRVEYPDGRADICTDPECFRAKVEAHRNREVPADAARPAIDLPANGSGHHAQRNSIEDGDGRAPTQLECVNRLVVAIRTERLDYRQDRITYALHQLADLIRSEVPRHPPRR